MSTKRRIATATLATALTVTAAAAGLSTGATASPSGGGTPCPITSEKPIDRGVVISVPDQLGQLTLERAVKAGAIFSVSMAENGTTGYLWARDAQAAGQPVAFLDTDYVPTCPMLVGSGGTRFFRYHADRAGIATLIFRYQR